MKKLLLSAIACASIAGLSACAETENSAPVADNGEVNLYSSRHYDTDLALYDDFTKQTGIKVNRIEADADALIERIRSEGEFSPADILITVDAGRLWRAEEAGVLAPVESAVLTERLPGHLRHPDGLWFGLSTRARIRARFAIVGRPTLRERSKESRATLIGGDDLHAVALRETRREEFDAELIPVEVARTILVVSQARSLQ
ncbi:MAG: hypothetical protein RQ806_11480, partial [Erythrobacter sp.]|nr:hypothetical protein [Erythrobacter sp.]